MPDLTFEQSLARLEQIVSTLEKGGAGLDESMALCEEGAGLVRRCGAMLDQAEQQVVRLQKGPDGAPVELPFDLPAEN